MSTVTDSGTWSSNHIPQSWEWTTFREVWEDVTNSKKKLKQKEYLEEGPLAVVDQGESFIGGYTDNLTLQSEAQLPCVIFGDHSRAVKYLDFPFAQGADGVKVLVPTPAFDPEFAYLSLRCLDLPDKGYSRHFKFLKASSFPIPPLAEQRRIVSRLDQLSARIRTAKDHLAHVQTLATRAKQATLATAFRGELTADWRKTNITKPKKEVELETLCHSLTDGDHQAPPKAKTGVPFITISAINDGTLRLDKTTRYVPASYRDGLKDTRRAVRGDILFSVTGSIAIPALVNTDDPFVFQRHIAILKPNSKHVKTRYLLFMLASEQIKKHCNGYGSTYNPTWQTAQVYITSTIIRRTIRDRPPYRSYLRSDRPDGGRSHASGGAVGKTGGTTPRQGLSG